MVRAAALVLALLVVAPSSVRAGVPTPPPGPVVSVVVYRPPAAGALEVVRPFAPPRTRFGPGHLGVDLRVPLRSAVLAAAAGTVTFAGSVAGRGVVVVLHLDGIRTEYEPLAVEVRAGQRVDAGAVLGHVLGVHGTCAEDRCLHWGARRGDVYLDPLTLLRPLGPVRLLPWSRSPP